jgi:hypothetical protein
MVTKRAQVLFRAKLQRPMTFEACARLVTEKISQAMPDVRRAVRGRHVTWSHGLQPLTVDASESKTWCVRFDRALIYDARRNARARS